MWFDDIDSDDDRGLGCICGATEGYTRVTNCSNFGSIQKTGSYSGKQYVGGIVGYSGGAILNSINYGTFDILNPLVVDYIGGICGK